MRQIQICAWLLVISTAVTACGGEQFTTSDRGADSAGTSASGKSYAPPDDSTEGGEAALEGGRTSGGRPGSGGSGGSAVSGGAAAGGTAPGAGHGNGGGLSTCEGSVTIKMLPSPELAPDFLCDASCGTGWLTITDALGAAAFTLFAGCGSVSCDSCSLLPCAAAACLPTPLAARGTELRWSGQHLAQDTCGAKMMACGRPDCVPSGRYKAKACAAVSAGSSDMAGGACTPKDTQLCAEVEFDFPGTDEVVLVLKK